MVMKQPVLPKNDSLLVQIFGYRKHLAADGYRIEEKDLPWTLSLAIHSDIIDNTFCYGEEVLPNWLKTSENDVQQVIKFLHQSLQLSLNEAVNGKMDSENRLSAGRNRSKRI